MALLRPFTTMMASLGARAKRLLAALPSDGSTAGGFRLREELHWTLDTYRRAKEELVDRGLVIAGVGHGGTLRRATPVHTSYRGAVEKEETLYQPFANWLEREYVTDESRYFAAAITATARGRRRVSGPWSNPDVTSVQVNNHQLLPGPTLEVQTFEVKRYIDANNIRSVYEAAAHARWAHAANLVIEVPPRWTPEDRFREELARFRVGLYAMSRRGRGWTVRLVQEGAPHVPSPSELQELLEAFFLTAPDRREEYLRAIGRQNAETDPSMVDASMVDAATRRFRRMTR